MIKYINVCLTDQIYNICLMSK